MAKDGPIGGEEWTKEFMEAIREAVANAVEEHHRAGRPVYVTDCEGAIGAFLPDSALRKLSNEEIEQLMSRA